MGSAPSILLRTQKMIWTRSYKSNWCDWSNFSVESNFTLKFLNRNSSWLGFFSCHLCCNLESNPGRWGCTGTRELINPDYFQLPRGTLVTNEVSWVYHDSIILNRGLEPALQPFQGKVYTPNNKNVPCFPIFEIFLKELSRKLPVKYEQNSTSKFYS